jgi:holo-[acyl-carrier protein] synthase
MNIGIDIEEVKRFKKYVEGGARALEKFFSDEEISYSLARPHPEQHLAARFAAKEAVWKALNHVYKDVLITDISIMSNDDGRPFVYLKGEKKDDLISISLSHTKEYVAAVALFKGEAK